MTLADRVVVMNKGVVQQVGTPDRHLRQSRQHLRRRVHRHARHEPDGGRDLGRRLHRDNNVRIAGLDAPDGPATLGFRAEDAGLTDAGAGQIEAPIYTLELLGDATMITVRAGGALVSVKAGKEFRDEIGNPVAISIPPEICHLFDTETGARIGA